MSDHPVDAHGRDDEAEQTEEPEQEHVEAVLRHGARDQLLQRRHVAQRHVRVDGQRCGSDGGQQRQWISRGANRHLRAGDRPRRLCQRHVHLLPGSEFQAALVHVRHHRDDGVIIERSAHRLLTREEVPRRRFVEDRDLRGCRRIAQREGAA